MTFEEYTRHIDWSLTVGRRRTRQTVRQAASTMREFEGAQALLEAEEAVDDPLRMTRSLLAGKAVDGIVNAVDREHREVVTTMRLCRSAWRRMRDSNSRGVAPNTLSKSVGVSG